MPRHRYPAHEKRNPKPPKLGHHITTFHVLLIHGSGIPSSNQTTVFLCSQNSTRTSQPLFCIHPTQYHCLTQSQCLLNSSLRDWTPTRAEYKSDVPTPPLPSPLVNPKISSSAHIIYNTFTPPSTSTSTLKMPGDTNNSKSSSTSASPPGRPRQQHHRDRTYQCLTVYSEYDCGHELAQVVRDPRCWKCEEIQPRLCRPSDWDIGADGLCPDCEMIRKGEELARQRRMARGLTG